MLVTMALTHAETLTCMYSGGSSGGGRFGGLSPPPSWLQNLKFSESAVGLRRTIDGLTYI